MELCPDVTRRQLLELAHWAEATLAPDARRRLVAAHLGFLVGSVGNPQMFLELLSTGVSTETAATLGSIATAGCSARQVFALYPDQLQFGTDRQTGEGPCGLRTYQAWFHAMQGEVGDVRSFDTCTGVVDVEGMQLGSAAVPGCEHDVPADMLDRFMRGNFLRLYD